MRTFSRLCIPLALVASLTGALPATGGDYEATSTIRGTLSVMQADFLGASRPPRLIASVTTRNGSVVRLAESASLEAAKIGALAGDRVIVYGHRASDGSFRVTSIDAASRRPARYPPPILGSEPWVTLLCQFAGNTNEPHDVAWFEGLVGGSGLLDEYWREVSFGQMDLQGSAVSDWVALPKSQSQYFPSEQSIFPGLDAIFADCVAAHDSAIQFQNFDGINILLNGELRPPGCQCGPVAVGGIAEATLDGQHREISVTWEGVIGFSHHGVLAQEMGHGLGVFWHSSGPDADSAFLPYDSLWDVMSDAGGFVSGTCPNRDSVYGCVGQHTILFHKDLLGWIAPDRLFRAGGGTEQVTIHPLDSLPATGFLGAEIPTAPGRAITVEVRRQMGFDAAIPRPSCVVLHRVDTALADRVAQVVDGTPGDGNPNDSGACWQAGESFTDSATGTVVTVDSGPAADGSYLVSLNGEALEYEFRPDALIGLNSDRVLRGDGVYNVNGAGQTRTVRISPRGTATFLIVTQNDSTLTDDLRAHGDGSSGSGGFQVSYFSGGKNITGMVLAGTATAAGIPPGDSADLLLVVKLKRSARSGDAAVFAFESSSGNDPSVVDVVRAKVKVR